MLLTRLDLSRNMIADVLPLSELTGLKQLYLYDNLISDVLPLSKLNSLETLELHSNAIVDFSPLDGLSANTAITQKDNPGFPVIEDRTSRLAAGVNGDGTTNILDLVLIAQDFGKSASLGSRTDVNGDGIVNILDLITVVQHLGGEIASAAPPSIAMNVLELDPAMIQAWIQRAQLEDDGSIIFQLGIAKLQSLLASLVPEKTALLPNYPNPFNPETWIPYKLAKPAQVTLTIHAWDGHLIRTLVLGLQAAGVYQIKGRAVYWDGRNELGEPAASGVYFYTLIAGDFTATRKMLIRK